MDALFDVIITNLDRSHFQVLLWAAQAEGLRVKYNITNLFDDLKFAGFTRTKQNALSLIEALRLCGFISLIEEGNKKNLYITKHGAKALENLVKNEAFTESPSHFLRR